MIDNGAYLLTIKMYGEASNDINYVLHQSRCMQCILKKKSEREKFGMEVLPPFELDKLSPNLVSMCQN